MKRNKNQDWTRVLQERLQDAQLPAPDDFGSWAGQTFPEYSGRSWPVAWWPWALGGVAVAALAGILFLRTPDNHARLNPSIPPVVIETPIPETVSPAVPAESAPIVIPAEEPESPAPASSSATPAPSFAGSTGESPAASSNPAQIEDETIVIPAEEPESHAPSSKPAPVEDKQQKIDVPSSNQAIFEDAPARRRKPRLSLRVHAASVSSVNTASIINSPSYSVDVNPNAVLSQDAPEFFFGNNASDGAISSSILDNGQLFPVKAQNSGLFPNYMTDFAANIINPVPVPRAPTIPVSFGVSAELSLSRHWSLVAGLDYTQRSGYRVYDNAPQSLTLHYLGIPLETHYIFWPDGRFRVYLGAGVKAEKSFLVTGGEPLKDPFLFSVNVQAGADVRLFPGVRLYFSPVLSGYLTHSAYANTWDSRPQFSLRAGLSFDL
ncbi:MAG: outer membrane beta-barrel protein [Bacteroidales bacterium]|nr:outer membrane beta-barrel protein [Bacteroidales bacterium]